MSLPFRFTGRPLSSAPAPDRRERIYLYDRSGNLVNDPLTSLDAARGLKWRTGLPGGVWDASFSVPVRTAEVWRIRPGFRVIIRRGLARLYDGRVEDITVDLVDRGARTVLCMGWWQELRQRTGSWSWSATQPAYADEILTKVLGEATANINRNYDWVQSPALDLKPIGWTRAALSEIVADLLKYGDDQTPPRPWYFAIWPTDEIGSINTFVESGEELVQDGAFETSSWDSVTGPANAYWSTATHAGTPGWTYASVSQGYSAGYIHAGSWSALTNLFANGDALSHQSENLLTGVVAGAGYTYDYWLRLIGPGDLTGRLEVDWYTSGDVFISTSTDTLWTDNDTPEWKHVTGTFTAPGTAAKCRVRLYAARGATGGVPLVALFDDVHLYRTASMTEVTRDDRARAHFWPKDTSAWDYEIRLEDVFDAFELRESTETLVNSVVAEYGTSSVTAAATDAESIAAYDQRDYVLSAGDVSATVAAKARDLYLSENKEPKVVSGSLRLAGPLRRARGGLAVHPASVRAGDRIKILDLPEQFSDFLFIVQEATYDADAGTLGLTPEAPVSSVDALLAQALGG